jgi:large repetitive protein
MKRMRPSSGSLSAEKYSFQGNCTSINLRINKYVRSLKLISALFEILLLSFLFESVQLNQAFASGSGPSAALPPVAVCKNITVYLGNGGTVSITGTDIDGGSYDPDGTIASLAVTPNTFTCSQTGPNNVILTVTDNEGLTATCTSTVTVVDNTPPVMACRNYSLYLDASGKGTLNPADINNGSSDNCTATLSFYLSRTSFDCSDIGSPAAVTLTGTDGSGNSSVCTAQVNVVDTISPVINVKPYSLVLGSSGTGTLFPANIDNGSFDNCGPVTLAVYPDTFTCIDQGMKTVTVTAKDTHGNSSTRNVTISVISTLNIAGMSLSSCDLSPTLALFEADVEGGNGTYSYFWKGLEESFKPFMVIIPFPPSLQFFNSTILQKPFFNNTMANGIYNIRFVVTDGNGCTDTSEIKINKTGTIFNNQTYRKSEACEGEIQTYSVNYKPDATYSWSITNGTILDAIQDTSRIRVRWNLGVLQGTVVATLHEPNVLFPGNQCESSVTDSVTISSAPVPAFTSPVTSVCANTVNTYNVTGAYIYQIWTVTGGVISGGGRGADNFVSVKWGSGTSGSVSVSVGNNSSCTGSATLNISISNLTGKITSPTNIKCNGGSDGAVTVAADSGTGLAPYMYSIDGGTWQSAGTFSGISLGNHIAHIRDALLCTFDLPFVITQPAPVSGTVSSLKGVSCFGGSNGSVTITAAGGTPPYKFSLNGGAYQGSNVFSGLSAGSYTVTIKDNNGCTSVVLLTVTQPSMPVSGSVIVTNVLCYGASTGAVNLTAAGGTPPYSYLWSNGSATEDIVNLPAGNYSVMITDSKGCTMTVPATVTQSSSAVSGSVSVTNVLCYGASTGSADLTASGGTPPYTFLWSNGATSEDLTGLPAGVYSVTITDANNCTTSVSGTVTQPLSALTGSVNSQNNVLCNGGNNGSVTVAGSGGTAPYEYRSGAGTYQASGTFGTLAAGTYTITIRDANLCTFIFTVTITQPASPLTGTIASQTNVLCFGGTTGSVTVTGSGGTSPYEYNIDGGSFQPTGDFGGLIAGPHSVMIRDKNLCTFSLPVTIIQPASALSGTIMSQTNVSCFGTNTGSVTVEGSGGTPPYKYSSDGVTFQSSGTFGSLGAGNHTIIVRDQNLCPYPIPVTITQPAAALSVTLSKTDVVCFGGSTGTATAAASGGTPPYSFSWNTVPAQTTAMATGLSSGTYSVKVTDSNGCTTQTNVTISQPAAAMSASIIESDVTCFGGSNGTIDLSVANGTAPMAYLWNNGAVTEDLASLSAGTYSVSVTDANGCTAGASGTINQPQAIDGSIITTDVVCFGGNTGSCNLTVTGGKSPYSFLWNNGATTEDILNLAAGTYSVTITDNNACNKVVTGNVGQPAATLSGNIISQSDVTVYGGNDGSVTVAGSGGTAPYQYSLDSGVFQASGTFYSLAAGSYTVTVQDAGLCTFNLSVTITQPWIPLTAKITSHSDVLCFGANTGSITITGWGGTSPYVYGINGGSLRASGTFGPLTAGNYTLRIQDAVNDVFDTLIIILQPSELAVSISKEDNHCFGAASGTATATATGGAGTYIYTWNTQPVQANSTAISLKAGTYTVTVTDSNGCTVSADAVITQPVEDISVLITKTDVKCAGGASGTASARAAGGTPPYTYAWNTDPAQSTADASGLEAGSYTVMVTDAFGCTSSASVDITEPQGMGIESTVTPATCPDSNDGSIALAITGGTAPYTCSWKDGSTVQNRTGLLPKSYSVVVTDNDACAKSLDVVVEFTGSFGCVEIPQVITPNGDGHNDEWRIRNIDLYPNAEISVYNRWGKLVFRTRNLSADPWNGRYNGELVPTDSYHYILYLNDGSEPKSGVISVIR